MWKSDKTKERGFGFLVVESCGKEMYGEAEKMRVFSKVFSFIANPTQFNFLCPVLIVFSSWYRKGERNIFRKGNLCPAFRQEKVGTEFSLHLLFRLTQIYLHVKVAYFKVAHLIPFPDILKWEDESD